MMTDKKQQPLLRLAGPDLENWLQAILENTLMSVMILKAIRDEKGSIIDFEYVFVNKKAEESVKRKGLAGKKLTEEFPGSKKTNLLSSYAKVVETGIPWEDEFYYNDDGMDFWTSVKTIKLDDGCLVTYSDITAQKQAAKNLEFQKELLQSTIDSSPNYIQVFKAVRDTNEKIVDFIWILQNHVSIKASGDVVGKQLLEVNPGAVKSGTFDRMVRVTESGIPEQAEINYSYEQFNDWFYQSVVKLDDGVAITAINITEKKYKDLEFVKLKEELQKKAVDRYNTLFNSIDQGFCTIKMKYDQKGNAIDYKFMEVSPSFEHQTGIKDGKGKWMRDIAADQDEFWFTMYGSVAKNRKAETFEYFSTPLKRWWSVHAFPIDEPELYHVGVLFKDITSRKIAEEEKEELFKNIARERAVFDATLDSLPIAVWIADKNGKLIRSNDQTKYIWGDQGKYAENIADYQKFKGWWPATVQQLKAEDWAMARVLLKGESVLNEELEIERFDGSKAFILSNAAPIRDEKDNIIGGVTIVQDITGLKKIETDIKTAEAKKDFLLKLTDAIQFLEDPDEIQYEASRVLGEYLGANRVGYAEDIGDGKNVAIKRNYVSGVPGIEGVYKYKNYGPELLRKFKAGITVIRSDIANDPSLTDEEKEEHKILQLGATLNKPLLKRGRLKGVLFVHFKEKHPFTDEEIELHDETAERTWAAVERARAEEALRKSEENYRLKLEKEVQKRTSELIEQKHFTQLITDSTPDIFFVYDIHKWKIVYVNKGITTTLGYTPEQVYSSDRKGFEQMLHPDDLKRRIYEMLKMVHLKPGEVRESEFRIKDSEGKIHWLNVRDLFFKAGENGKTSHVLSICQDVTEKVEALSAYREEKTRSEELKRMNEVMDTFVFAAAHDLKSPVSNLKMLTEIIEKSDDLETKLSLQKKYAEVIDNLDRTITGLVKVLAVEKDESSGVKTLNFTKIFSKVAAEFREELEEVKPVINIDFSECKSIVYIESYLFSIFRNMLSNAMKFRSEDKKLVIDIRSGNEKNYIWLSFSDNGIGIELERYGNDLFKPFKRFSSTAKGSGLGLHLVKSIVTKNGGKVDIKSNKNKGTTFTVFMVPYKI
jgi:PAS domain S-box-containing protein